MVSFQNQKCAILTHLAHRDVAHLAHSTPDFGIVWGLYQEKMPKNGMFCCLVVIGMKLATILVMVKKIEKVAHDAKIPERKMVN